MPKGKAMRRPRGRESGPFEANGGAGASLLADQGERAEKPDFYEELLAQYLLDLQYDGLSDNSRLSYGRDIKLLLAFLAESYTIESFEQITSDMVKHYLADLYDKEAKATTAGRKISAFRKFFTYLLTQRLIRHNPMDAISLPKKRKQLPQVLSESEMERLLEVPDLRTPQGIRDRAILEVFYATGMRVSELCSLKLSQLHLLDYQIDVIGKGNKARLVLVGEEAIDALNAYLSQARDHFIKDKTPLDLVFLTQRGQPFTRQGIWKAIKQMVAEAGIQKTVTPHTLRHSIATHLLAHGMNLRYIQDMLGHENLVTTEIYTHVDRHTVVSEYDLYHPHSKKEKGEN